MRIANGILECTYEFCSPSEFGQPKLAAALEPHAVLESNSKTGKQHYGG